MAVRVQREDFDLGSLVDELTGGRQDVGAVVTFTGICRADGETGPITAMVLEHYPGMAEAELARVEADARARWPLADCLILHRYGRLVPGERIMAVVTASAHRQAAFEAASFLMDYLKNSAPFWKKEHGAENEAWVSAKASDDDAYARWTIATRER